MLWRFFFTLEKATLLESVSQRIGRPFDFFNLLTKRVSSLGSRQVNAMSLPVTGCGNLSALECRPRRFEDSLLAL